MGKTSGAERGGDRPPVMGVGGGACVGLHLGTCLNCRDLGG